MALLSAYWLWLNSIALAATALILICDWLRPMKPLTLISAGVVLFGILAFEIIAGS